jgi:predicted nucleotide-binding protein (sugar kinase/HSP70/actin superfamily)
MVINTGRAVYLHEKGVDGIIDISPFTCMNAIVCEAIYSKLSRDHDNIPIKVLYFDGKARDWDQDVEMFMELVRDYRERKRGMVDYGRRHGSRVGQRVSLLSVSRPSMIP